MQMNGADFEDASDTLRLDNCSWDSPARSVVIRRSDQILPFCLLKLNRDMAAESTAKAVLTARTLNQIKSERDANFLSNNNNNNNNNNNSNHNNNNSQQPPTSNGETTNGHSAAVKVEKCEGDFYLHRTKRGHGQFKGMDGSI